MEIGAEGGAELVAEEGINIFDEETAWDVVEEIPNDSAAVLLLAVPASAVFRADGRECARRVDERPRRHVTLERMHAVVRRAGGAAARGGKQAGAATRRLSRKNRMTCLFY